MYEWGELGLFTLENANIVYQYQLLSNVLDILLGGSSRKIALRFSAFLNLK